MKPSEQPLRVNLKELALKVLATLQEKFPEARLIPEDSLIPAIHAQIIHAYIYKLETEQQFSDYVVTAWLLGQDFDTEFPVVKEIMDSSDLTPAIKSKWLSRWTEETVLAFEKSEE